MSWDTPTMFKRNNMYGECSNTTAVSTWVVQACVLDEAPPPPDSGWSSSPGVLSATWVSLDSSWFSFRFCRTPPSHGTVLLQESLKPRRREIVVTSSEWLRAISPPSRPGVECPVLTGAVMRPSEGSGGAVTVEERGAPSQRAASGSWLTSSPAPLPSLKMLSRTDALGFFLRPRSLGVFRSFAGLISLRRIESATTALNPPDRVENKGPGEKCAEMEFRGLRGGVCGTVLFRELLAEPSPAPVLSASGAGGNRRSTVELAAFCTDCFGGVTGRSVSGSDAVRSKVSAQGFLSKDEG